MGYLCFRPHPVDSYPFLTFAKYSPVLIAPFCYRAQTITWILAKIIEENDKQISVPLLPLIAYNHTL